MLFVKLIKMCLWSCLATYGKLFKKFTCLFKIRVGCMLSATLHKSTKRMYSKNGRRCLSTLSALRAWQFKHSVVCSICIKYPTNIIYVWSFSVMLRILKNNQRGKIKQLCHKIFVCLNLSSSEILSAKCFLSGTN